MASKKPNAKRILKLPNTFFYLKEELKLLEDELEALRDKEIASVPSGESERFDQINEQYDTTKAKLNALKLKNAKKNREISVLKRKLDEIPSRIELTQYQKRFIELYNQS